MQFEKKVVYLGDRTVTLKDGTVKLLVFLFLSKEGEGVPPGTSN